MLKIKTQNSKPMLPKLTAVCLGVVATSLLACGRDTMIYPDPAPPAATPSSTSTSPNQTITIVDHLNNLPAGFLDQSVNGGSAQVALDSMTSTSTAIHLQTEPQLNSIGGYNGSGTGNTAILGAIGSAGTVLNQLSTLTFNVQTTSSGSATLSVTLLVDLQCDSKTFAVLKTSSPQLLASVTPIAGSSYVTYNAGVNQNIWQSSGSSIANSSGILVPSTSSGTTASLANFIAANPKACIVNRSSDDPALPNGIATAGILIALGTPATTDFNSVFINSITIGATTTNATNWSQAGQ